MKKYTKIASISAFTLILSISLFFNLTGVLRAEEEHWLVKLQTERVESKKIREENRKTIENLTKENQERIEREKCIEIKIDVNDENADCEGL